MANHDLVSAFSYSAMVEQQMQHRLQKEREQMVWSRSHDLSKPKGFDPIRQYPLTSDEVFFNGAKDKYATQFPIAYLYVIPLDGVPRLQAVIGIDRDNLAKVVGRIHLDGGYVVKVHEAMQGDPVELFTPKLETPFKVTLGEKVLFELTNPEWIAKASANILLSNGSQSTVTDAYSTEMMGQYMMMSKRRRAWQTVMIDQIGHYQDMYDRARIGLEKQMGIDADDLAYSAKVLGVIPYERPFSHDDFSVIQKPKVESLKDKIMRNLNLKK